MVGMGGEEALLACAAAAWLLGLVDPENHPAARKPGVLRTELFTLISRSPTPSLIVDRYEVRNCQMVKLTISQCASRDHTARSTLRRGGNGNLLFIM